MKTIILTFALASFIGMSSAQTNQWPKWQTPDNIAKSQTEKLTKSLRLSSVQSEKVYAINLEIDQKYDLTEQGVKGTDRDYQRCMNRLGDQRDSMMECVLNSKQYFHYRKIR